MMKRFFDRASDYMDMCFISDDMGSQEGLLISPKSWDQYFKILDQEFSSKDKAGLAKEKIELAWKYAYHFFFTYPFEYPWHMRGFFDSVKKYPLSQFLSEKGKQKYSRTIQALLGEPTTWTGD